MIVWPVEMAAAGIVLFVGVVGKDSGEQQWELGVVRVMMMKFLC